MTLSVGFWEGRVRLDCQAQLWCPLNVSWLNINHSSSSSNSNSSSSSHTTTTVMTTKMMLVPVMLMMCIYIQGVSKKVDSACRWYSRSPTAWFMQNGWASAVDSMADLNNAQLPPFVTVTIDDGFRTKSLLTKCLHVQSVVNNFLTARPYQALKQRQ